MFPYLHVLHIFHCLHVSTPPCFHVSMFLCLHVFMGALTLRPPTNRPRDIPTHTICPQNILSTVTIFYCDTLTMWHFSTVTFWLCYNLLLWHFNHVTFSTVTFFYCDIAILWQFSTVTLPLCDIFLLWPFTLVTIFYSDIPIQSGRIVRPSPKSGLFVTMWHFDPL